MICICTKTAFFPIPFHSLFFFSLLTVNSKEKMHKLNIYLMNINLWRFCERENLTNSTAVFKYHINISVSVFNPEVQHPRLSFYNLSNWQYRSKCRGGRGSRSWSWSWVTCWIKCRSWYSITSIVTEILTFKKGLASTKSLLVTIKNLFHTFSILPIKFTYLYIPT